MQTKSKRHLGNFKKNRNLFSVKKKIKKFGCFIYVSTSQGFVKDSHLDFVKKCSKSFFLKKDNPQLFFKVKPSLGVTKKPVGARLGKGKGNLVFFVSKVFPGSMLFGLKNISFGQARFFLKQLNGNFPVSLTIKKYSF